MKRELIAFFEEIGVESHFPDGFRVFPKTHSSQTIINALEAELVAVEATPYSTRTRILV